MSTFGVKEELHSYLRGARETLLWKLEVSASTTSGGH
jgi:hypothetical protein